MLTPLTHAAPSPPPLPSPRAGKLCIEVTEKSRIAWISEELCIGCGICVKKCPFEAITIINLPRALGRETTHRYGPNSFKLHRLPMPRPSQVLGLVGTNGIGKSTALKVLAGKLKPNLGKYDAPPVWEDVLRHFRGSELQNYFTRILEDNLRALIKPQYVDNIPKAVKGNVGALIRAKDERGAGTTLLRDLQLDHLVDRDIEVLSGGELQRFAIAMVAAQAADVYMFDEPSSYLDVRQRLKAGEVVRSLVVKFKGPVPGAPSSSDGGDEDGDGEPEAETREANKYVIVVEHDLAVLDYLSDYICVLYGTPGAYGVVTMPFSVREGINIFLAGFVPTENLRFREDSLSFKVATVVEEVASKPTARYKYPEMHKVRANACAAGGRRARTAAAGGARCEGHELHARLHSGTALTPLSARLICPPTRTPPHSLLQVLEGKPGSSKFALHIMPGEFSDSQIVVMLGENGTGKTTFIRMLAGLLQPDVKPGKPPIKLEGFSVSYKPQKIAPTFEGSVRALLFARIKEAYAHPQFNSDVVKPLNLDPIVDQEVKNLSGGELQRVALVLCLGKPADVYLIDEPSAYLDSEQRIIAAKVIKRFILHAKKTAFIVEHDFIMGACAPAGPQQRRWTRFGGSRRGAHTACARLVL
jgi:ATP-binding cassette, sub-family E, member 1